MFIIILILALLPAALLWLYIWKKDPNKEPTGQLVKATLLGVVICIPVAVWEVIVSEIFLDGADEATSVLGVLVDAFMVAAIPEECAKLLVLWLFLRRNRNFDEHFDGIIYAVCVGLGFAAVENVFYVMDDEDWLFVAIFRGLLSVPGHYAFAVLMGYYYSVYHFVDHSKKAAARVLLVPIVAHGIYDVLAMGWGLNPIVGVICFIVLIAFCVKMHLFARKKMKSLPTTPPEGEDKVERVES